MYTCIFNKLDDVRPMSSGCVLYLSGGVWGGRVRLDHPTSGVIPLALGAEGSMEANWMLGF